jgi:hypothetical protein
VELIVTGCDRLDKIVVYKNLRPWQVIDGESLPDRAGSVYKVRVELGWGGSKTGFQWEAKASVRGGELAGVETCFRGRSVLAPSPEMKADPTMNALGNKLISQTENEAVWSCMTFKNPTTLHPHTAGVILEIQGDVGTIVEVTANGTTLSATIGELLEGNRTAHLLPYNSEAIVLHQAVAESGYAFSGEWRDKVPESDCDVYHAEVRQVNGQCAWISPIYVMA